MNIAYLLRTKALFFYGLTYALNYRYIAAVGTNINMSDIYLLVELRVR